MSNFEMTGKTTSDFEQPQTGMVPAVCINVVDGKYVKTTYMGQDKGYQRKIFILWEIAQRIKEGQFAGQHMVIAKEYTFAVGDKANLRIDLESWRGKKFEERKNADGTVSLLTEKKDNEKIVKVPFAVDMLIGANCILYLEDVGKSRPFIKPTKVMKFDSKYTPVKREYDINYIPNWLARIIEIRPLSNPDTQQTQTNNEVNDNSTGFEDEELPF
ncbi:phage replication initiation protein, NGO0469 family [Brachyspira pilosicoli]